MNTESEKMYRGLAKLAVELYYEDKTITTDDALIWINQNYPQKPPCQPYVSFRSVPQAAYTRAASEIEREALASVFVGRNGKALVPEQSN